MSTAPLGTVNAAENAVATAQASASTGFSLDRFLTVAQQYEALGTAFAPALGPQAAFALTAAQALTSAVKIAVEAGSNEITAEQLAAIFSDDDLARLQGQEAEALVVGSAKAP